MIGVPLHHRCTLLQVLSLVDASNAWSLMTELRLNVVRWKTALVEYGACNMTEAMSSLSSIVTKAP